MTGLYDKTLYLLKMTSPAGSIQFVNKSGGLLDGGRGKYYVSFTKFHYDTPEQVKLAMRSAEAQRFKKLGYRFEMVTQETKHAYKEL